MNSRNFTIIFPRRVWREIQIIHENGKTCQRLTEELFVAAHVVARDEAVEDGEDRVLVQKQFRLVATQRLEMTQLL